MRHILIATHGRIASGLKSALKLFLNKADDITVIDAYVGEADENYERDLELFLGEMQEGDEAYIFTDIKAGSVNQKVMAVLDGFDKRTVLVTNINLPLLVGLLAEDDVKTLEEIKAMIEMAQPEVISLEELKKNHVFTTEKDFF